MKFGELFHLAQVAEWAEFYLNYIMLKKLLSPFKMISKKLVRFSLEKGTIALTNFTAEDLQEVYKFSGYFDQLLFHDYKKIGLFFVLKLNESYMKWKKLKLNAMVMIQSKDSQTYMNDKFIIKEAYHIFYKELKLLQEFFHINMEACKKILKKHKKFVYPLDPQSDLKTQFDHLVKESGIQHQKERMQNLTQLVESDYLEYFYKKYNRKEGLTELRKINQGRLISQKELFQFGLFAGFSIILIVMIIVLLWNENVSADDEKFRYDFPLFRGIGIIIVYLWLLGWNVYGWTKYNVNYKLIFKFNYHYSQISEILKRAAFFTTIFLVMLLWYLILLGDEHQDRLRRTLMILPKEFAPLLIWLFVLGYFFFPMKTLLNPLGRLYTFNLLVEMLKTPFVKVTFASSWATDQLASFVVPLKDFEYLLCFYTSDSQDHSELDQCNSKDSFSSVVLMAFIPLLLRILQCGRQIYDSSYSLSNIIISPFFFNALKYLNSLIVVISSYLAINHPEHKVLFAIWIVFALISIIYSYYWDLKYDWGFLEKNAKYPFLRSTLSYTWPTIYYIAMLANLVLRIAWVFSISPDIVRSFMRPEFFTFVVGFSEIFRRSIWNFLRVEKEHIHNCGSFKAVEDIKLPYDDIAFLHDHRKLFKTDQHNALTHNKDVEYIITINKEYDANGHKRSSNRHFTETQTNLKKYIMNKGSNMLEGNDSTNLNEMLLSKEDNSEWNNARDGGNNNLQAGNSGITHLGVDIIHRLGDGRDSNNTLHGSLAISTTLQHQKHHATGDIHRLGSDLPQHKLSLSGIYSINSGIPSEYEMKRLSSHESISNPYDHHHHHHHHQPNQLHQSQQQQQHQQNQQHQFHQQRHNQQYKPSQFLQPLQLHQSLQLPQSHHQQNQNQNQNPSQHYQSHLQPLSHELSKDQPLIIHDKSHYIHDPDDVNNTEDPPHLIHSIQHPNNKKDMIIIKYGSQMDLTKDDLINSKKNPFSFTEWKREIKEFKMNVVEKCGSRFVILPYSDLYKIKAKNYHV